EPCIEIACVVEETVGLGRRLSRLPHAHQIRRKASPTFLGVGNDVAPQIGRGWISVQKDDGVAVPFVYIGDLGVEDACALARMRIGHASRHFFYTLNIAAVRAAN